jgi:hypothetical protein
MIFSTSLMMPTELLIFVELLAAGVRFAERNSAKRDYLIILKWKINQRKNESCL